MCLLNMIRKHVSWIIEVAHIIFRVAVVNPVIVAFAVLISNNKIFCTARKFLLKVKGPIPPL